MPVSTLITQIDYGSLTSELFYGHKFHTGFTWDEKGVHYIIDSWRDAGVRKLYWRTTDGGHTTFPSKIGDIVPAKETDWFLAENVPDQRYHQFCLDFDLGKMDFLKVAVEYAHKVGVELHAWHQINEEDHGYGRPKFVRDHPRYWRELRDGQFSPYNLAYCYPEVNEYKLGILREVLEHGVDGVMLDFARRGSAGRKIDDLGFATEGYDKPIVEAYQKECGIDPHLIPNHDPHWVQFRSRYITRFLGQAKELVSAYHKPLVTHVAGDRTIEWSTGIRNNGDYIREDTCYTGQLQDAATWVEKGCADAVCMDIAWVWLDEKTGWQSPTREQMREHVNRYQSRFQGKVPLYIMFRFSEETAMRLSEVAYNLGVSELVAYEGFCYEAHNSLGLIRPIAERFNPGVDARKEK